MQIQSSHIAIVALSLAGVLADVLLKCASQSQQPFRTSSFALGAGLYGLSSIGWVLVLRLENLSTIGALYSSVVLLMLVAIGVFGYGESLSIAEMAGLACAFAAVILLSRLS